MGLLKPAEWKAKWIGRTTDIAAKPAPLLRHEFKIDGHIKQARAYISGLGYYELYLNGKRVGDHILDPGYTRYDRRVLYVTYDVTDLLNSGPTPSASFSATGGTTCKTRRRGTSTQRLGGPRRNCCARSRWNSTTAAA